MLIILSCWFVFFVCFCFFPEIQSGRKDTCLTQADHPFLLLRLKKTEKSVCVLNLSPVLEHNVTLLSIFHKSDFLFNLYLYEFFYIFNLTSCLQMR